MLSRVQSKCAVRMDKYKDTLLTGIKQLYILGSLPNKKLYADNKAIAEIKRLESVSLNSNPSMWNRTDADESVKIAFLNANSIKEKCSWIKSDYHLQKASVICLSETWLEVTDPGFSLSLPGFKLSLCNVGRGQGLATYHREEGVFTLEKSFKSSRVTIIKLTSDRLDIISIYRSSDGDLEMLVEQMRSLISPDKNCVVGGDMNLNLLESDNNIFTQFMKSKGFQQLVKLSTHIGGGLLDHCYVKIDRGNVCVELCPKVYSDHDAVLVSYHQIAM